MDLSLAAKRMILNAKNMEKDIAEVRGFCVKNRPVFSHLKLFCGETPNGAQALAERLNTVYMRETDNAKLYFRYIFTPTDETCVSYILGFTDVLQDTYSESWEPRIVKQVAEYANMNQSNAIIVAVLGELSISVQNTLMHLRHDMNIRIDLFSVATELQFNPLKHVLVPPYRILSPQEIQTLCIDKKNLPIECVTHKLVPRKTTHTGPIAKFIGAEHGDVLEIDRTNLYTYAEASNVIYRVVCDYTQDATTQTRSKNKAS